MVSKEPDGSEIRQAIDRALESANLRAGDATSGVTAHLQEDREPSAVEADGFDGDGD